MLHLALLSKTEPDWNIFQSTCQKALKRNIFAQLDSKNIMKRDIASFIMTLGEFVDPGEDPTSHLSDPGYLLRTVHINVICIVDDAKIFGDLAQYTDLDVMSTHTIKKGVEIGIASGTLQQWRTSIINCLSERKDEPLREFFSNALMLFQQLQLGKLWERYTQTSTLTGIRLTEK